MINVVDGNGNVLLCWQAHQEWIWQIIKINDELIASIGEDGLLKIWNLKNGTLINVFQNHSPLNSIAFNDQQSLFSLGNAGGDIQILFFEKEKNKLKFIRRINAHHGIIRCLKFYNKFLISGGEDSKVKVWETKNVKCIQTIQHNNFVQDFLVNENQLISVSYDGRILTNLIEEKSRKK